MCVSNWTRRPNKCVNFDITLRRTDSPAAVTALITFLKQYVDTSAEVRQGSYKKIALTKLDPGFVITVIFYTQQVSRPPPPPSPTEI